MPEALATGRTQAVGCQVRFANNGYFLDFARANSFAGFKFMI
jgi:hypothetical protein